MPFEGLLDGIKNCVVPATGAPADFVGRDEVLLSKGFFWFKRLCAHWCLKRCELLKDFLYLLNHFANGERLALNLVETDDLAEIFTLDQQTELPKIQLRDKYLVKTGEDVPEI